MSERQHILDQATRLRAKVQAAQVAAHVGMPQVVAIASGKGGVGKSNVAVNVACTLGRLGKRTLLFDADFGLGNTDILLGIMPKFTLADVVSDGCPLADVVEALPHGVSLLPAGSGKVAVANADSLVMEGIYYELEQFTRGFDVVVLDTGAGIGDRVLDALLLADRVLIVTTPDPTSLTDSYATIKILTQRDATKQFGVIVNMVANQRQGEDVFAQLAHVAKKYLGLTLESWGIIPLDPRLQQAVRRQQPVVECFPGTIASLALQQIARRVAGQTAPAAPRSLRDLCRQWLYGAGSAAQPTVLQPTLVPAPVETPAANASRSTMTIHA